VIIGLFLIYTGFWGFYASCNIPIIDIDPSDGRTFFSATTIYGTPTTLSAITVNFMMSLSGGFLAAYLLSKGDPYWTFSGGLAGVISSSPANDLYHPYQAFLVGAFGVLCLYRLHYWVERRFKIDDAVGAVAVHGYAGTVGVIVAGFLLWGYPSSPNPAYAPITPWGQALGALIMFLGLGFVPCYLLGLILKRLGKLRIPVEVELMGLDYADQEATREQREEIAAAEWNACQPKGKAVV
jgi:Amt family ammonium transporter